MTPVTDTLCFYFLSLRKAVRSIYRDLEVRESSCRRWKSVFDRVSDDDVALFTGGFGVSET